MKTTTPTPDTIPGVAALFAGIVAGQTNARTREALANKTVTPAAMLATELFFQAAITTPQNTPLFRQLAHAWGFFQVNVPGTIGKSHYGHAKWWQLNILTFMLTHPKPDYRTREFSRHLKSLKIPVDPADLRRFCRRHRIARDTRPGRPKLANAAWVVLVAKQ